LAGLKEEFGMGGRIQASFFWLLLSTSMVVADDPARQPDRVRFATYNIQELSAEKLKQVDGEGRGNFPQLLKAAEILQRIRPDVLLINEIDYDDVERDDPTAPPSAECAAILFRDRYLSLSQNGQPSLEFPFVFYQPSNTGVPTGKDLDNDGRTDGPADSLGFGNYRGQYGMALYSRFPIDTASARTFRRLLWKEMPGNLMPDGTEGKPAFYSPDEVAIFRLSSKSHWDAPIRIGECPVHILASHPTPPVFDGPEDSNGRRNFDEIRFWRDYLEGGSRAAWIHDDSGHAGGLAPDSYFVVLGDLNSDPVRGDAPYGMPAVKQLLELPQVQDPRPVSHGATLEPNPQNLEKFLPHKTSKFGRLDYCLPSKGWKLLKSEVFWPGPSDPLSRLIDGPELPSDHFLVWVDLAHPDRN